MQTREENGLVTWANDRVVLVPSFDDSLCLSIITTTTMKMTTKRSRSRRRRATTTTTNKNFPMEELSLFLICSHSKCKSEKENYSFTNWTRLAHSFFRQSSLDWTVISIDRSHRSHDDLVTILRNLIIVTFLTLSIQNWIDNIHRVVLSEEDSY